MNRRRTSERVAALMTTVPGAAAACSRSATSSVVPSTTGSGMSGLAETTARPVWMPTRSAGFFCSPGVGGAEVIRRLGDQVERGTDGAPGVVFVRLRIAEVDEHAMADDVADRRLVALRHLLRQRAQPHHQLVERLGVEGL